MKVCKKCGQAKDLWAFQKDPGSRDGLKYKCRACLNEDKREWRSRNIESSRASAKRYSKNNPEKRHAWEKKWRDANPVKCRESQRRWSKDNPDRVRYLARRSYLKKYGLTPETYDSLLLKQGGGCAICGAVTRIALAVDHNHKTGQVRGLLCMPCNTSIGHLHESKERLDRAKTYLAII